MNEKEATNLISTYSNFLEESFEKDFDFSDFICDSAPLPFPKDKIEEAILYKLKTSLIDDEYDYAKTLIFLLNTLVYFQEGAGSFPVKIPEEISSIWNYINDDHFKLFPLIQKIADGRKITRNEREKLEIDSSGISRTVFKLPNKSLLKTIIERKRIGDITNSYIDEKIEDYINKNKNQPEDFGLNDCEIKRIKENILSLKYKYSVFADYGMWFGIITAWGLALYLDHIIPNFYPWPLTGLILMLILGGGLYGFITMFDDDKFAKKRINKINNIENYNDYEEALKGEEVTKQIWGMLKKSDW